MVSLIQPTSFMTKYLIIYFPALLGKNLKVLAFPWTPPSTFQIKELKLLSSAANRVLSFSVIESEMQLVVIILLSTLGALVTNKSKFNCCSPLQPSAVGLLAISSIL